jgi:hypothetical protein
MSTVGIKETKDVINFTAGLIKALIKSFEDGKLALDDLQHFTSVIKDLPSAAIGISGIPEELKDLDTAEIQELVQEVSKHFENEATLEVLRRVVRIAQDMIYLYQAIAK